MTQAVTKVDARGNKRHCQSDSCGLPFYDLNRDGFACPNCGAAFNLSLAPVKATGAPPARFTKRMQDRIFKPVAPVQEAEVPAEVVDDEALVVDAAEIESPQEADTILETEDEELADDGVVRPGREGGDEE